MENLRGVPLFSRHKFQSCWAEMLGNTQHIMNIQFFEDFTHYLQMGFIVILWCKMGPLQLYKWSYNLYTWLNINGFHWVSFHLISVELWAPTTYTPRKTNMSPKKGVILNKGSAVFQSLVFRGHVSFRWCTWVILLSTQTMDY